MGREGKNCALRAMVKVDLITPGFSDEGKMPLLVTAVMQHALHDDKPLPPSPGEDEGKDGGTAEHLAALQRRLRASEQVVSKLKAEVATLRSDKNGLEADLRNVEHYNEKLQ